MKQVELHYSLQLHARSGLLVAQVGPHPAHSFTKQFAQLIFNISPFDLSRFTPVTVTDTSSASVTNSQSMGLRVDAGTATSTYGIQVGTSTSAESINDVALGTQIAHGTSAGQLQYGSMTFGAPSTTATTTTFRCTRVFTNGSGGTVTVQEIGLVSGPGVFSGSNKFLLIRDLTGAVPVNNGQQLTVNYDFTTTI